MQQHKAQRGSLLFQVILVGLVVVCLAPRPTPRKDELR